MKSYFSALPWVSNLDYDPNSEKGEIENALVLTSLDDEQDLKIGERIIPSYMLLLELHIACVKWIKNKYGSYYDINNNDLKLNTRTIIDIYEELNNLTYLSWVFSNDPIKTIPEPYLHDGTENIDYKLYKKAYIETVVETDIQEENLKFFFKECDRIEIVDVIYDCENNRKIYKLDIKPFKHMGVK